MQIPGNSNEKYVSRDKKRAKLYGGNMARILPSFLGFTGFFEASLPILKIWAG